MKRSVWVIFMVLLMNCVSAVAQRSAHTSGRDIGNIYGKLVDSATGKSIAGASILVISPATDNNGKKRKDITLATQLTDKRGQFNIENLPVGIPLSLKISTIGYRNVEINIRLAAKAADGNIASNTIRDLGNIRLSQNAEELQNITIVGGKPLLTLNLDKKVYNVEKDISATGGTAIDVMKNIPSVNVDIDGNVTLRNASPQIFVDGRPTTLTLDQIPADQISYVEIMTNPSAKYDASGGGSGILNIVLKKNKRSGYNGNLRANVDSRGRPGFGGDINIKQDKVNFFAAGNLAFRKTITNVNSFRLDTLSDGLSHIVQTNRPVNNSVFAFGRLGMDYFIDNRNTVSVSGNMVDGTFKVNDRFNLYRDSLRPAYPFVETGIRTLKVKAGVRTYGTTLGFKHNFARADRELTIDGNFNYSENYNTSDYNNTLFDVMRIAKPPQGAQRATGGGHSRLFSIQSDYTDPFSGTQKIDFGLRAVLRSYNNWNDNYLEDVNTRQYMLLPDIGVRYNYSDVVMAAYTSYSQTIKKFSYQLGLRVESSEYKGNFISKNQRFSNQYPLSLFPGAFLSYKVSQKDDVQFNYSRKINRPNFFQLIPFVDFSDSLNLSVGNPSLKPEFTHLMEIAYNKQYGEGQSLVISLYGKLTDNLITRYQYIDATINPLKPALYTTYANARNSTTAGLELTGKNSVADWWDIVSNINLFHVTIKASNLVPSGDNDQFSWFAKLNNSFKLPANYSIQLSGDYQAKTIMPAAGAGSRNSSGGGFSGLQTTAQGYIKSAYGADIAIKKDFLKNNAASLTLQMSDIFRTRVYTTHANGIGFMQDNRRRRDPQVLRLNFTWRFGKFDMALLKRKNTRNDLENIPE